MRRRHGEGSILDLRKPGIGGGVPLEDVVAFGYEREVEVFIALANLGAAEFGAVIGEQQRDRALIQDVAVFFCKQDTLNLVKLGEWKRHVFTRALFSHGELKGLRLAEAQRTA